MNKIEVFYNGEYPNTCSGRLIIKKNGKEIYNKNFCCLSYQKTDIFNDNWSEPIGAGKLIWEENNNINFSKEIQNAVQKKLSEFSVCCGGCI